MYNERYFVLFLCYFAVGCGCVGVWGWGPVFGMLKLDDEVSIPIHLLIVGITLLTMSYWAQWTHRTPRTFTLLLWILALVMCFAVGVSDGTPDVGEHSAIGC